MQKNSGDYDSSGFLVGNEEACLWAVSVPAAMVDDDSELAFNGEPTNWGTDWLAFCKPASRRGQSSCVGLSPGQT